MSEKFPYDNFTPKELYDLESTHFFLFMGGDAICMDGVYTFTKSEIAKLYNEVLRDLVGTAHDGLTEKDRKYSIELIGSLAIVPVKIH